MVFTAASRAEIRENDKTYLPKCILRLILTVFCLVSIGCIAWVVGTASNPTFGYDSLSLETAWTLIPLSLSVLWTLFSLTILLSRRRPVHPGLNVAFDLILILIFVITGLLATAGVAFSLRRINAYGAYNTLSGGADTPPYPDIAANGSTIYITPANAQSCPRWNSCAEKDAFVGFQHRRSVTALVGCIFLILALMLHLAVFISACIDTHRHRRAAFEERAALLAEKIVKDMREQRGDVGAAGPLLMSGALSSRTRDTPAVDLGNPRERQGEADVRLAGTEREREREGGLMGSG